MSVPHWRWRAVAAALVLACAAPVAAQSQGQSPPPSSNELSRSLGVTVPESASATVRMLNLSKGTRLAFAMQAQEALWVAFLDEDNFKRYPNGATALLTARVAPALSFGVQVPAAGNYYLVLDNRERAEPNKVQMQLRATMPPGARPSNQPKPLLQQY